MNMKYSVLICAAGSGTRMKLGYNKVYAKLNDGQMIIDKTINVFLNDMDCEEIVVVSDPDVFLEMHNGVIDQRITLVQGGNTRQESVYHGLVKVKNSYVMIHDGARPFLNQDLLDSIKNTLTTEDACLLMVPCKDTIKKVIDGYVETTYDRSTLMAAQTPQAFKTDLILSCTKKAMEENYTGTDDASLVEKYSDVKVKAVEGSYANIKITTIEDLKG